MSNHTLGPWRIRAERYQFIRVYAHGGGIAHLDTIDEEGMANARLIAAAPDMLAVLQSVARLLDDPDADQFDADKVQAEVLTVIAKATR